MKREIRAEGREEGRAEGLPEGKIELLIDPVKGGKLSAAEGAKQLNISITEFESLP